MLGSNQINRPENRIYYLTQIQEKEIFERLNLVS